MGLPNETKKTFRLGRLVATPGALAALERSGEDGGEFVRRHKRGDWGNVSAIDAIRNDAAIFNEGNAEAQERVFSAYRTRVGEVIWIITEADRSSTCVLLPADY